jgi:hypothetical protein
MYRRDTLLIALTSDGEELLYRAVQKRSCREGIKTPMMTINAKAR